MASPWQGLSDLAPEWAAGHSPCTALLHLQRPPACTPHTDTNCQATVLKYLVVQHAAVIARHVNGGDDTATCRKAAM